MKCAACGDEFAPKTKRSKFCEGADCKRARARAKKQAQRAGGQVIELRPPVVDVSSPALVDESVRAAVVAELDKAGQRGSVHGRAALALADRIDRGGFADTGSSLAALVRELRSTIDAALASAEVVGPVDELRRKRLERLGRSG